MSFRQFNKTQMFDGAITNNSEMTLNIRVQRGRPLGIVETECIWLSRARLGVVQALEVHNVYRPRKESHGVERNLVGSVIRQALDG